MKRNDLQLLIFNLFLIALVLPVFSQDRPALPGLKDAFYGKFYIGAAINTEQIMGKDSASLKIIKQHYNTITAENCMKMGSIHPEEDRYEFSLSDKFVEFGEKNNMFIIGHNLIWHSQAPKWFFTDDKGKDVSREVLIDRMKEHIQTIAGRYKGKVKGWDVVNEAIMDDGSWRQSKFYQIIGEDFVKLAFQFAHEADPDAELYYNDYSMSLPGRREGVVKMVKNLQQQGIRIDCIGMQGHCSLDFPKIEEFEKSIQAFTTLGVKVMITEMDISVLPTPKNKLGADIGTNVEYKQELNPYTQGLPDLVAKALNERYMEFFNLFLKYPGKISRVTFWGIHDGQSWKNNFPVKGRTDYPLPFNRDYQPKEFVKTLLKAIP